MKTEEYILLKCLVLERRRFLANEPFLLEGVNLAKWLYYPIEDMELNPDCNEMIKYNLANYFTTRKKNAKSTLLADAILKLFKLSL